MSNSELFLTQHSESQPEYWREYDHKWYRTPGKVPDPVIGFYPHIRPAFLGRKFSSLRIHLSTLLNGLSVCPKMSSDSCPHISLKDYPDHKALLQAQVASLEAMAKCGPAVRYPPSEQALNFLVSVSTTVPIISNYSSRRTMLGLTYRLKRTSRIFTRRSWSFANPSTASVL